MRRTAFTVGPRNVNRFEPVMRVIKVLAKSQRIGQIGFERGCTNAVKHRQTIVKVIEGFLEGH